MLGACMDSQMSYKNNRTGQSIPPVVSSEDVWLGCTSGKSPVVGIKWFWLQPQAREEQGIKWQPCPASFYPLSAWAVCSLQGDCDPIRIKGGWLWSCHGEFHCAPGSDYGFILKWRVQTFWKERGDRKCNMEEFEFSLPSSIPILPW